MIEVIKRIDGGLPTAFRCGSDVVTEDNFRESIKKQETYRTITIILAAIECGFVQEEALLKKHPSLTLAKLTLWRNDSTVKKMLATARKETSTTKKTEREGLAPPKMKLKPLPVKDTVQFEESDTILTHREWRFCAEKRLLAYRDKTSLILPRYAKLLGIFFSKPGVMFTGHDLHFWAHNTMQSVGDRTIPDTVSRIRTLCELMSGDDKLVQHQSGRYWI